MNSTILAVLSRVLNVSTGKVESLHIQHGYYLTNNVTCEPDCGPYRGRSGILSVTKPFLLEATVEFEGVGSSSLH